MQKLKTNDLLDQATMPLFKGPFQKLYVVLHFYFSGEIICSV